MAADDHIAERLADFRAADAVPSINGTPPSKAHIGVIKIGEDAGRVPHESPG